MNIFKIPPRLALCGLILASLACNLSNPASPTESPSASTNIQPTDVPATEPPAQNACENPYAPVIAGATWDYNIQGTLPDTYTHTILSVDADGFVEQDAFASGVTRQAEWKCENGNLIALNPPGGTSGTVNTEGVQADFHTTALDGVTLPGVINPGDTWTQSITLEGTETINGIEIPASNQTTSDCTAIGIESVTVAAGTFDAMRVDCVIHMNITVTMSGIEIPTILDFTSTSWYARNVGLVKNASVGSAFNSTTDLVSYNIP